MKPWDANQVDELLNSAAAGLQQHDISAALDQLLEAYRLMPDHLPVLNLTGRCYQILGEFERAERCWQEVKGMDADHPVAESNLNEFYRPAFQFWLKRYRQALTLVEKKKFYEARVLLRQLMEEHDEFVALYQVLGLCHLAEGDRVEAHRIWKKGLEIDRSNPRLKQYLQMPERKVPVLDPIPAEEPAKRQPLISRNRLLVVTGILCLALVVQTGTLMNTRRQSSEFMQDAQQRIRQLSEKINQPAVKVSQTPPLPAEEEMSLGGDQFDTAQEEHYFRTGYGAYQQGRWSTAVSNLGVVVSMNTGSYLHREALYYLARTYYVQNDYGQAERFYVQYLQDFPDSNYYDDTLFYLACTYYYSGRLQSAQETLDRLAELYPESGYLSAPVYQSIRSSS